MSATWLVNAAGTALWLTLGVYGAARGNQLELMVNVWCAGGWLGSSLAVHDHRARKGR